MRFYPPINPALLDSLGQAAPQAALPNFQQTLAQAGLQAPPQPPPTAPQGSAGPMGGPSLDAMDATNANAEQALRSMTPAQRQAVLASQTAPAALSSGTGGLEAPKPIPKGQADSQPQSFVDWTPPGGQGAAAAPSPVKTSTIPAHEVSMVSPNAQANFEGAQEEKKQAAGEAGAAEQGVANAQAGAAGLMAEGLDKAQQEAQAKENARQKALAEQQADLEQQRQAFANAEAPHDRRSGLARVSAAIAAGLGQFGAGLTHTNNAALEIINASINRDLEEQRDALSRKGKALEGKGQDLQRLRERFGDERAADAAFRQLELEKYKLRGDQMVAQAQSPVLAAKWKGVQADIDAESAKQYLSTHQWMQPATVTTGGAGAGQGVSDVKPDEVMQLGDGRYVTVPEKDREKVIEAQNKANAVEQAGNELKRLTSMPISERAAHPIDWAHQFDAAKKTLLAGEISGGGKGGKGIFDKYEQAIGSRTLVFTPGLDKSVTELVQAAKREANNHIANSAQYEVTPQLVRNPKTGIVERKYVDLREFQRPRPVPTVKPAGSE